MHCQDETLLKLLREPDTNGPHVSPADAVLNTDAMQHLETCSACQSRITELAADPLSWHEAAAALSDGDVSHGSIVIAVDGAIPADLPVEAERISLDFLQSPRHPELLGRMGRYDVERLIGTGGMGIVFKAFDTELHRPVAVKVLAPHLAHSGGARQRFAREAQSAAAVVHENVVPIHDVNATEELPYLVMQFVAGESLQHRVDRLGPLSINEVLRLGKQISAGLAAAHDEGLVHRDVKPGNILLEQSVDRVMISDFGLARAADDASMTRSGVIAGTPHYMSPEQARGTQVDFRSDLFGLGSVLYFMCTGRPPFRAEGPMAVLHRICTDDHRPVDEVNELVPADLAELIDQLLAKDPARRPQNAGAVADALTTMLHDTRSRSRFRKTPQLVYSQWIAAAGVGLALLGTIWGLLAWASPGAPNEGEPTHQAHPSDENHEATGQVDLFEQTKTESDATFLGTSPEAEKFNFYREVDAISRELQRLESQFDEP